MKNLLTTHLFIAIVTSLSFSIRAAAYKHLPYEENLCSMCHQSDSFGKTIADKFSGTQPEICYQCHEEKVTNPVVHPAMFMGDCTSMCHSPHESNNRPLLREKISILCTTCHSAPGIDEVNKHSAVDMVKSCIRCHSPHSSELPKLLRADSTKLCVYCHKDIAKGLEDKTNLLHPALSLGCQSCHQPHGSPNSKLMEAPLNDLCFKCHNSDKFQLGHPIKGHPLSGINDPMFPEKNFSCISCHKPHFSKNENLLRYRFKQGDGPYNGSICSVCHWQTMLPPPKPPPPKWDE